MELDVVELDGLGLGGPALRVVVCLVVEPQLEVGHPRQLAVALHDADDLGLDDVVVGPDQHRQLLGDVQEELVLGVLDAFGAPGHHVRHLLGRVDLGVELLLGVGGQFVGLGLDELAEELELGGLGVAVVHHLVQQLVHDHEVVADGLLLHLRSATASPP